MAPCKHKKNVHIKDIMSTAGITQATAGSTLRRLVKANRITFTGGQGRWRRYHLPA